MTRLEKVANKASANVIVSPDKDRLKRVSHSVKRRNSTDFVEASTHSRKD